VVKLVLVHGRYSVVHHAVLYISQYVSRFEGAPVIAVRKYNSFFYVLDVKGMLKTV
jgi:hypothetical protein